VAIGVACVLSVSACELVAGEVWLAVDGDDQRTGRTADEAVRSATTAQKLAQPGDSILLQSGTYPPLKFVALQGTQKAPIMIRPADAAEGKVILTSGDRAAGIGLSLEQCSHVVVRGMTITNSQKGIDVQSCRHCVVSNNSLTDLGQEGIHVGRLHTYDDTKQFLGPASEHVEVVENRIIGTGKVKAIYGEGIYIGTGAFEGDDTHDVLIERNVLNDISAEGIELKPGTTNLIVRGNQISNTHHEYNAAITIAIEGTGSPDGNYLVEHNRIWNIKKVQHGVAGIAIGHGNAIIRNNLIWNIEGGIGIRVYQTFRNPESLTLTLERNTVIAGEPGESFTLHNGTAGREASPFKAVIKGGSNLTDDGSGGTQRATPNLFRGPFLDDADAGQGPGTGFMLKKPSRFGVDFSSLLKAAAPAME
jgi:hypothetical protein